MSDHFVGEAARIHEDLPVVDGHNDLPWAIRTEVNGSLAEADPGRRLTGFHTDIPRLLAGGVGAQLWSVYVPAWSDHPLRDTLEQIDLAPFANEALDLATALSSADLAYQQAEVTTVATGERLGPALFVGPDTATFALDATLPDGCGAVDGSPDTAGPAHHE